MSTALDKELELSVSFSGELPGDQVSSACLQEIGRKMRVSVPSSSVVNQEVKISPDGENILTKNESGELRVQSDTYYSETQTVPVPPPVQGGSGTYAVPVTRFRVTAVILEDGTVVDIPDQGQGAEPAYPSDLGELVDNLNAETPPFTWGNSSGVLTVSSDLGFAIRSIIEGGPTVGDALRIVEAEEIAAGVPGNVTLVFNEARVVRNIDYASVFDIGLLVWPGSGYTRATVESITSQQVRVIVERVSKPLNARLTVFTPAQKEDRTEF